MQTPISSTVAGIVEYIGANPLYGMKKLEIEIRAMVEVATQEQKAQLNKEIDAYRNNFMEALNGNPYPAREPYPYPKLVIKNKKASIFDYEYEDFELVDYKHHPGIAAPVAV